MDETISVARAEAVPSECDKTIPDSSQENDTVGSSKEIFWQMLAQLGLTRKYPGKITIKDIIKVDASEWNEKEHGTLCPTKIPWLILKRLISSHSESRDISVTNEPNLNSVIDIENNMTFLSDKPHDKQDISRLDAFFIVFQCCDPFLKQVLVQKLFLCKIAVPFLYKYWETKEKQVSILSVWPLRSLTIQNNQTKDGNTKVQCKDIEILELPTKMIAFGRMGRPNYSKSKLMNSILSDHGCKTFYNFDCNSGMTERQLSNGHVEIFWLPLIGDKKDRFQEPMTFLNLRGDLQQHFDAEIITFISTFVDTLTIIVDIETILKRRRNVTDVLLKFSSVILIIANPIKHETTHAQAVNEFRENVLKYKSNMNLRVLSTHNEIRKRNVVEMVSFISVHITDQLKSKCTKSYQERLRKAHLRIRIDEKDENCQIGKQKSNEMIKQMNSECLSCSWKQNLTPVHSKYSKKLGKLIKKREREKGFEGGNAIDAKIKNIREVQIMSITKSVKLFIKMLIKHGNNLHVLKYFLCWLHIDIAREKQQSLPELMKKNQQAWINLKLLKSNENQDKSNIEKQENIIKELEKRIDEASFSIDHFFREIGHINEAILQLEKDSATLELPPLSQMSSIIARLVADGHQLELIDGESFYMPYKWIKAVINDVDQYIGAGKALALSVLGLQSSGKSTFLNTMFGCQFSTRTGRCTRGIHAQLIPVDTAKLKNRLSDYNFIFVIDTEGLRSPELSNIRHEHDNELATAITGIGDITLVNIMGENTSEIRDILQVIVHALLRLKMTNKDLDIKKSCCFIHQNVTDTSASENMMTGLNKLIQTLDEMTEESAKSENIKNITTFNHVIEFDINSQVWYLKNLWQGNPPMARVNTEYSERVMEIKSSILKKAFTIKDKSYKSLNDITEHAYNIWKGVLNEDFVFSFRNSIEIKAYNAMERFVQDQLFHLEILIRDKILNFSQKRFASCNQGDNLSREEDILNSDLKEVLLAEKIKCERVVEEYFKKDKYKDIIIQWQENQVFRLNKLCETLEQSITSQINKDLEKRAVEILTVTCQAEHEEELRRMSMKIALENRGKTLSRPEIDKLFDSIWETFVTRVKNLPSNVEKNRKKTIDMFYTCLKNTYKSNQLALRDALTKSNRLTPLPNLTTLKGTFKCTGIDKNDISLSKWQTIKDVVRSYVKENIEPEANEEFERVDKEIERICQVREEITENTINKFLRDVNLNLKKKFKGNNDREFQMSFYEKFLVHVIRHAHVVFEKHNDNYFKTYGVAARLTSYKKQQKIKFEAHLRRRFTEDDVSKLFTSVIESFAEEWTTIALPNRVTDDLYAYLPSVKNRAIIEICSDLLEKDEFDNFIRYIRTPRDYASSWITHKANHFLFAPESMLYAKISSSLLRSFFLSAKECIEKIRMKNKSQSFISMNEWVNIFQILMKESSFFIPSENFRSMKRETETTLNLEYLTYKVLDSLKETEADLVTHFNEVDSGSVQWENSSPIGRLIQKIWGCQEQCPFCGEPCTKNEDHTDSDHNCMQHRPLCCIGIRFVGSQIAELASCEFNVQTDITHRCEVFDYKCNNGKREPCSKEWHPYKDYKTILDEWYIAPSANMQDTCRYWMWFVATYKDRLLDKYQYKFDDIPSSWKDITKSSALKSLSETYSV
ncbi:interferon-induced very large GTPase 1-like [Ruditapes philippinarum]|uniref:interferon-induced very large GTPase 1-like n=1 Tax=Ruditapes philippinarum TaxID=129788 RepID=UPI00295A5A2B|nr:interferon-induced very large GTPase 1-like [Ruditapes philippinarum]